MELSYLYLMTFLPMAALAWAAIFPAFVRFPSGARWTWGLYGAAVIGVILLSTPGLLGLFLPSSAMAAVLIGAAALSLFGAVTALTSRAPPWARVSAGAGWILLGMSLTAFLSGALAGA